MSLLLLKIRYHASAHVSAREKGRFVGLIVRKRAVISSLLSSLILASACAPVEEGESTAPAAAPQLANTSAAEELATLPISFTPCPEDPELRCGALQVPLDHGRPHGAKLSLAVIKAPALGPRKKGAIFVNPGGPGGSGVDLVLLAKPLFASLREHFDIVSFDPRGVARSHPVACSLLVPPPPSGTPEALAAFLDEMSGRFAQACAAQNGELVTRIGTNEVARDMDRLRAALGERELNYLGFSYGTILGASYATLFPQRVRAMVLDANASPVWLGDYLLELDSEGSTGAELALRRLDQLCRADASCPLHSAGVAATLERVVARYDRAPVEVGTGFIDGQVIRGQTFGLLYNERLGWPFITQSLAMADAGDLRGIVPAQPPADGVFTFDASFAVMCNDSRTRRPALDYLPAQLEAQALSPHFGGLNLGLAITACARWPLPAMQPIAALRTRNPVVLIGNDFDPATPMSWARNMATALGTPSTLVRYRGGGHGSYGNGSACIDDAVEEYFRDPSAPPQRLTCPAQPISFAPLPLPSAGDGRDALAAGDDSFSCFSCSASCFFCSCSKCN